MLRAIDGYTGREVIGIALKLALLFFVRPGELRKARWRQFDLPTAQWLIPADCMKARVQHPVPLSRQALELLQKLGANGIDAMFDDLDDGRAHGRDERIGVLAFDQDVEFTYRLMKVLSRS